MRTDQYFSEKIFLNEQNKNKSPVFVCEISKLKNEGDFVVFDFYGEQYVAQKGKEKISIFENKCLHRNFPLKSKDSGNEKVICPYHGWFYNYEGKLIGVPKKDCFEKKIETVFLKRKIPEICGNLLFASIKKGDLKNHLGKLYFIIETITKNINQSNYNEKINYQTNWKLCVENSLDEYHIVKVHPTNAGYFGFMKYFKYYKEKKNLILFSSTEKEDDLSLNNFIKKLKNKKIEKKGYKIFFIYPNLFLHIYFGMFYYTNFLPIKPDKTINKVEVFTLKQNNIPDEKVKKFINNYFLPSIYEDKKIVEDQLNFYQKNKIFKIKEHFSIFERRIKTFRKNIT